MSRVTKLLLDKDADANWQGGDYGNALYAASDRDHKQVVKLLLDKDAGVDALRKVSASGSLRSRLRESSQGARQCWEPGGGEQETPTGGPQLSERIGML